VAQPPESQENVQPPQPPEFTPKFKLYPYQYIGIPIILLIPILALLGVFGEKVVEMEATSADLQVRVEYPIRTHYRLQHEMQVMVTNVSGEAMPSLTVRFDIDLMRAFSDITFTQEPDRIATDGYEVMLEAIAPGETRIVGVDVRAERYWAHDGVISVTGEGIDPVSIPLSVFIFP
jgi:hypothetical protein